MRKVLAIILVCMVTMICGFASADTVYTKIAVDGEAVRALVTSSGLSDEQLVLVDPILALINALGVKVITVADGAQIDLDLNGKETNSLGFKLDDKGITVANTLFPNYLITVSQDTITQLMTQFMTENSETGSESSMDMNALVEKYGKYYQKWFETCIAAGHPGEPETGKFEIDGLLFDTRIPVTVDMPAILEATKTLADELMANPAFNAMPKSASIGTSDNVNFEETMKAGITEWMANMPASASADYYISSQDSKIFYLAGDSFFAGKDEASCHYQMMMKGDGIGYFGYWDHRIGMIIGFEFSSQGFRADFTMDEVYLGIDLNTTPGEPSAIDLNMYFMNPDAPLANVNSQVTHGGKRTLLLNPSDKTVLTVEEIMNDGTRTATQGLLGDVMINGLSGLMNTLQEQVPEISRLLGISTNSEIHKPEKTDELLQAEVNPSEWKTLADVRSLKTNSSEGTWDDQQYIYIFDYAGTKWMVTAEFSKELQEAYFAVDFFADDRDEQIEAILGPCKIKSVIDLKTLAIPQEELDHWIGKTGKDLLDAGWEYNGYTFGDKSLRINMINGRIEYLVSFVETIEAPANFDEDPNYAGATISGIQFSGNSYHFFDEEYSANPWTDSTREEIASKLGVAFGIPNDAENISYSYMADQEMAEMQFTLNGMDYVARIMPAYEFTDISGLYYSWDVEDNSKFAGMECLEQRAFADGKTIDLCQWFDKDMGLIYSLSTSGKDLSGFDITAVAAAVYVQAEEAE